MSFKKMFAPQYYTVGFVGLLRGYQDQLRPETRISFFKHVYFENYSMK